MQPRACSWPRTLRTLPQGVYGDPVKISQRHGLKIIGLGAGAYLFPKTRMRLPVIAMIAFFWGFTAELQARASDLT